MHAFVLPMAQFSWSARAAITKYHRLEGLNNKFISHSLGGWKSKIKVLVSLVSPAPLFLARRWSSSSRVLTWHFLCAHAPLVSLCVRIFPLYKDIGQIGLGATTHTQKSHFNLIISLKTIAQYGHIMRYWG